MQQSTRYLDQNNNPLIYPGFYQHQSGELFFLDKERESGGEPCIGGSVFLGRLQDYSEMGCPLRAEQSRFLRPINPAFAKVLARNLRKSASRIEELADHITQSQPKCTTQYARGPMPPTHSVEGN